MWSSEAVRQWAGARTEMDLSIWIQQLTHLVKNFNPMGKQKFRNTDDNERTQRTELSTGNN